MTAYAVLMAMTDQILTVARAYCDATKLSLSRVSTLVFNDGKKLERLEDGFDLQTAKYEEAMAWFSAHWPKNTRWPKGIARPTASIERAAS